MVVIGVKVLHRIFIQKNIRNPRRRNLPPTPQKKEFVRKKGKNLEVVVLGVQKINMTFWGLGEMFKGYSAATCGGKVSLKSMGAGRRI